MVIKENNLLGLIFSIERFAIHDGPGIRTLVFFKGCPLRCMWCDNPESQLARPEIAYYTSKCVRCYRCLRVCPTGAIEKSMEGPKTNREICNGCGICVEVCPTGARRLIGKFLRIEEVMEVLKKDTIFYRKSGGGVTLSGGEPLAQPVFTRKLLEELSWYGIHTAIETSGYAEWPIVKGVISRADLVLYDIKHMESSRHKAYTGVYNDIILENVRRISDLGVPLILRIPVIPSLNDSLANIKKIAMLARELDNCEEIHLLPYHRLGVSKYKFLEREYALEDLSEPDEKKILELKRIFQSEGLKTVVGG
jgi:pyruvate formate lyase activating enzyme